MISFASIQNCEKEALSTLVPTLGSADIAQLVSWLSEKDDNFRYKCSLLLQARSRGYKDVYPYWDVFVEKLNSNNSYQRSLGLMLLAENTRWDESGQFDEIANRFLSFCDDEKPVTVRRCIQSLNKIIPYKKSCLTAIVNRLIAIDLMQRKETQRKILLMDILSVLLPINRLQHDDRIDRYFQKAMTGGFLDNKSKRLVESF